MKNKNLSFCNKELLKIQKRFGLYHQIATLDLKDNFMSWVVKHDKRLKKEIIKNITNYFKKSWETAKITGTPSHFSLDSIINSIKDL